ncbi:MAG: IS3 family transposase [Candidatus Cloacimonetes bacterium]|nr:IS3 family transposase [Candidatus Cloacimonadota bacterium]MDD4157722.1 IS3 family transposase [Candidatus Cloacimonadota bacterium]
MKHEYGFKKTFKNLEEVKQELHLFVKNYNNIRIYESLKYLTPKETYDAEKKAA